MSRRTSLRALAQTRYREKLAAKAQSPDIATPLPNPPPHPPSPDGLRRTSGGGESKLLALLRALYEGAAVPVAEIARVAGITERTIYKYAAKGNWQPRYAWTADGRRPRGKRRKRGARWLPRAEFAPVKGAGGRFRRRADRGKRFAKGLHATDARVAARAAADCAEADALARQAETEAAREHWFNERMRAWGLINRTLGKITDYEEEYRKTHGGQKVPADDKLRWAMGCALRGAMNWLEAIKQEEAKLGG